MESVFSGAQVHDWTLSDLVQEMCTMPLCRSVLEGGGPFSDLDAARAYDMMYWQMRCAGVGQSRFEALARDLQAHRDRAGSVVYAGHEFGPSDLINADSLRTRHLLANAQAIVDGLDGRHDGVLRQRWEMLVDALAEFCGSLTASATMREIIAARPEITGAIGVESGTLLRLLKERAAVEPKSLSLLMQLWSVHRPFSGELDQPPQPSKV